jgi:hypothetical protein
VGIARPANAVPGWLRISPGMHTDSDSRVWIQEFLCKPQIRIRSVPYGTVPLLRIQLGCKHFLCKGTYHLGHLVEAQDAISWVIPGPWYYHVGPEPPKPPELSFSYHFMVIPLTHKVWTGIHFSLAHEFGGPTRMPRCLIRFSYADKSEIFKRPIRNWKTTLRFVIR